MIEGQSHYMMKYGSNQSQVTKDRAGLRWEWHAQLQEVGEADLSAMCLAQIPCNQSQKVHKGY